MNLSISALIPVYNAESFLADAIENILAQVPPPLEIIIIDDGSTDHSRDIAASFGDHVRLDVQPHRGLPLTRNRGLELARGDLIAFLDADDVWSHDKLALQLNYLDAYPEMQIIAGHTQLMNLIEEKDGKLTFENWGEPTLALSLTSALIRRQVFDQIGLFDRAHQHANDIDWFLRAREAEIPLFVHPEVVLYYRRHTQNMSNAVREGSRELLRSLKHSLDRRSAIGAGTVNELPPL